MKATARRGGGPRLSLGEWTALIILHRAHANDPGEMKAALDRASDRLAMKAGGVASARAGTRLRSPSGLRRRLTVVRALEAGRFERQRIEARAAMKMVAHRPVEAAGLAAEVLGYVPGAGTDRVVEGRGPREPGPASPSRGPEPTSGPMLITRQIGESWVYVMRLTGRAAGLLYDGDASKVVVKIGHSADPLRRREELQCGFPPDCGLEWRLECKRAFPSAMAAYEFEQQLLALLCWEGLTLGGEFARMPETELPRWLAAVAAI